MQSTRNIKPVTSASDWSRWPNFSPHELQCRGTGKLIIDPRFLDALQNLRKALGHGMVVTSGCRAASYNSKVGGHPRSLHVCDEPQHLGQVGTIAVDVGIVNSAMRGNLVSLAWKQGWSIGWGHGFMHLDRRDLVGLPQTTFDYY